jgi:hypothetical protein
MIPFAFSVASVQVVFLIWLLYCCRSGNIFAELGFLFCLLAFIGVDVIATSLYLFWRLLGDEILPWMSLK